MAEDDLDPSLTKDDGEHIAEYLSEFLECFVIIGVDQAGKMVSVIRCPDDATSKQALLDSLVWFYKNKIIVHDEEG